MGGQGGQLHTHFFIETTYKKNGLLSNLFARDQNAVRSCPSSFEQLSTPLTECTPLHIVEGLEIFLGGLEKLGI